MYRIAIGFLVIALLAAFVGLGGVPYYSWEGATALFFVCLALAFVSFLGGAFGKRVFRG